MAKNLATSKEQHDILHEAATALRDVEDAEHFHAFDSAVVTYDVERKLKNASHKIALLAACRTYQALQSQYELECARTGDEK